MILAQSNLLVYADNCWLLLADLSCTPGIISVEKPAPVRPKNAWIEDEEALSFNRRREANPRATL